MTDLLADGVQWLGSQLSEFASRAITYVRGSDVIDLNATVGQSMHDQRTREGLVVRIKTRDYLVEAKDLVIDGNPIEPQRNDRILETVGGLVVAYDVLPAGNDPCWRWSGSSRTRMRITRRRSGRRE